MGDARYRRRGIKGEGATAVDLEFCFLFHTTRFLIESVNDSLCRYRTTPASIALPQPSNGETCFLSVLLAAHNRKSLQLAHEGGFDIKNDCDTGWPSTSNAELAGRSRL
jgi:hypothetical protein